MGHKVFLSPSDQTANTYAVGNTNEAEQCGRIAVAASGGGAGKPGASGALRL